MSILLNDFDEWPSQISQASIPANNNVRRMEILVGSVVSASTTAQPATPNERDIYIIPGSATGAQWANFDEGDIAIFYNSTWTAYSPFEGLRKFVLDEGSDGQDWQYIAGVWSPAPGAGVASVVAGTGIDIDDTDPANPIISVVGGGPPSYAEVSTISVTSHDMVSSDANTYMRFTNAGAKTLTVQDDSVAPLDTNTEYHGRNVGAGALTLVEDTSVTINPPAGGTLVIAQGGTFTLKRVAADEFDLIGITVPV